MCRGIEPWIEARDGPQSRGRPKVGRVQPADDAKARVLRTRAHDDWKDFVAGYVGVRRSIDIDVQIVQPIFWIEEASVHRHPDPCRCRGESFSILFASELFGEMGSV